MEDREDRKTEEKNTEHSFKLGNPALTDMCEKHVKIRHMNQRMNHNV